MLKLDAITKSLVPLSSTTLTQSNILERAHLQEAIVRSWDSFINELGYEELFLVGSEIVPHDSCDDRIDLLAISREGTPVIFELKRHRDRLQLLQAISYAAMVAKWDADRFRHALGAKNDDDTEELRSLLEDDGFELGDPEIVLVAESFDPEVILAAEWLSQFGVPISAFAISAVEHRDDTLIAIDQRFPLAGVDDIYVRRSNRRAVATEGSSWDDVVKTTTFPFAKRAVDIFRKRIEGSPHLKKFGSIYADSPLGRMSIAFTRKHLRVHTSDQSSEAEEVLRNRLEPTITVKAWGNKGTKHSGFVFNIATAEQFEHFLRAVGDTEAAKV